MKTQFFTPSLSFPVVLGTDVGENSAHLHAREILRLTSQKGGIRLTCLSGTVWITQPGDPYDHMLQANETFTVNRPGLVLAQALPDALIRWQPGKGGVKK